jgi:hypothetical protein
MEALLIPQLTGTLPDRTAAIPAHSYSKAQDPTVTGCSALRTVLGLVHTDQLAF